MIALSAEAIDPALLLAEFTRGVGDAGAVVSFSGFVRRDHDVTGLWLDYHELLTLRAIEALGVAMRARFGLSGVAIVHRVGAVGVGEPIVFVAAAATHRRAAFNAVDFAMDQLKSAVPLWKKETRGYDQRWIEARAQDRDDAARWEQE